MHLVQTNMGKAGREQHGRRLYLSSGKWQYNATQGHCTATSCFICSVPMLRCSPPPSSFEFCHQLSAPSHHQAPRNAATSSIIVRSSVDGACDECALWCCCWRHRPFYRGGANLFPRRLSWQFPLEITPHHLLWPRCIIVPHR